MKFRSHLAGSSRCWIEASFDFNYEWITHSFTHLEWRFRYGIQDFGWNIDISVTLLDVWIYNTLLCNWSCELWCFLRYVRLSEHSHSYNQAMCKYHVKALKTAVSSCIFKGVSINLSISLTPRRYLRRCKQGCFRNFFETDLLYIWADPFVNCQVEPLGVEI